MTVRRSDAKMFTALVRAAAERRVCDFGARELATTARTSEAKLCIVLAKAASRRMCGSAPGVFRRVFREARSAMERVRACKAY